MPVPTLALLATLLLPALAAARSRPPEVRRSLVREVPVASTVSGNHSLRPLPRIPEPPSAYELVTRWVADQVLPGPDGKPKLVVVAVRGGLGIGWARRW